MASQMGLRIGAQIRKRRTELGLTQKQVARAMNEAAAEDDEQSAADAQRVSDWERGYNKPSERYLRQLVAALQVPDVTFFFEEPDQPDVLESLATDGATALNGELAGLLGRLTAIETKLEQLALDTETRDLEVQRRLDEIVPPNPQAQDPPPQ